MTESNKPSSKALHVLLWVVQVLLGLFFLSAGGGRAVMPIEHMVAVKGMEWTAAVPVPLLRFIGVAELFGALGLIVPAATRIKPLLTPLAALGLAFIMVLAAIFHLVRGEPGLAYNSAFFTMAALIAYGRWKLAPIPRR